MKPHGVTPGRLLWMHSKWPETGIDDHAISLPENWTESPLVRERCDACFCTFVGIFLSWPFRGT
jgi:hypothetical protein